LTSNTRSHGNALSRQQIVSLIYGKERGGSAKTLNHVLTSRLKILFS